eukprot:scaffold4829_cov129-Cylindrotheca_fusiformis.AAC.24
MEGMMPLNDKSSQPKERPLASWSFSSNFVGSSGVATEKVSASTMHIRITNATSGHFKDLMVAVGEGLNMFDSIYDNHEVKTHHVRKWSSEKTKEVKAGTSEIYISVVDEKTSKPLHSYSIGEMKKTSIRTLQRYSLQLGSRLNLLLRCERKRECASSSHMSPFTGKRQTKEILLSPNSSGHRFVDDSIDNMMQSVYSLMSPCSSKSLSPTFDDDATNGTIRVRVENETTGRSKELLIKVDHELNLYDSIYNDSGVKKANVRKWGQKIAKEVKEGTSEIACLLWDESIQRPYHTFSVSDLKLTSTKKLFEYAAEPTGIVKLVLRCEKVEPRGTASRSMSSLDLHEDVAKPATHSKLPSIGDAMQDMNSSGTLGSLGSSYLMDELERFRNLAKLDLIRQERCDGRSTYSSSLGTSGKETMRVRVTNSHTSRYKDLVVDVRDDLQVFNAVYNNPGVKAANVRKWSSDIVQAVQNGSSEIVLEIWDHSVGIACRILLLRDLMHTTTRDLMEMAPGTDAFVEVRLRCVKKPADPSLESAKSALKRGSSLSAIEVKPTSIQPKRNGSVKSIPQRHMAHMSTGNLNVLGARSNPRQSFLKASMSSFQEQITKRSNYQFALSGLSDQRNQSWQTAPAKQRQAQLFLAHLNSSFPASSNLQEFEKSGQQKIEHATQQKSEIQSQQKIEHATRQKSGKKNVATIDDKVQRFLTLSDDLKSKPNGDGVRESEGKAVQGQTAASSNTGPVSLVQSLDEFRRLCRSKQSKELLEQHRRKSTSASVDTRTNRQPEEKSTGRISTARNTDNCEPEPDFPTGRKAVSGKYVDQAEQSLSSWGHRENMPEQEKRKSFLSSSSNKLVPPQQPMKTRTVDGDGPPVAEISVVTTSPISSNLDVSVSSPSKGVSLSGEIVKDVFPYHVVLDSEFRILQVGNSLSMLFETRAEDNNSQENINFEGRIVSDVFMITGPIPMYGKWDWSVLDRMKEKTIFIESVLTESLRRKARLKGTIIEMSRSPRQIMLSLLPNVKNLTELSDMNLSMGDLPLHTCQREAVLLGEHSASEVKLTNHLDILHRDLINSMEQQINDRTAELARANHDLERANTQVQRQSARQLEHFACMSHEIRTPLNCIVGMSSILLEETHSKIDPMHAESIKMIYNSGELLRAVVDDVLDYAKLESGSFEVDICKTNLQESLSGVAHSISQKIQEKNIRLRRHFSPDLPQYTETDSRRLQQVLFNLLGNSGKFSKRNSVIDLSVRLVPKSRNDDRNGLAVDWEGDARELKDCDIIRFSVTDYGKGIEKKDFKTIFQPFSQASKHTATVYGGTGLGLSITSKLVNTLGGRIAVDSEVDKFTKFIVDLPLKGAPVDIATLKKRLQNVCIITIQPAEQFDYSFTTYPIAEEPRIFGSSVCNQYGLSVLSTHNIHDLKGKACQLKAQNPGKHFALLVDEVLYNDLELARTMEELGKENCTLMTFGPNYEIEATKKRHFRSLKGVFPCILLDSIANYIDQSKHELAAYHRSDSLSVHPSHTLNGASSVAIPSSQGKLSTASGPRIQNTTVTKPTKEFKYPQSKQKLKVLYAEDNKINQKVLTRVLNRVGIMDVTIVDDGLKAVNITEKESYDIIFMDMQMPVMDGVEACNLIVERDKGANVIFVTAHALDEFKHKARAAGGVGFISKPFRIGDIEKVVSSLDLRQPK